MTPRGVGVHSTSFREAKLRPLGFATYAEYLASPHWRDVRRRVFAWAESTCVCGAPAEHVHHRTYARLGHELDADLLAVCASCHRWIHAQRVDVAAATDLVVANHGPIAKQHGRRTRKKKRGKPKQGGGRRGGYAKGSLAASMAGMKQRNAKKYGTAKTLPPGEATSDE